MTFSFYLTIILCEKYITQYIQYRNDKLIDKDPMNTIDDPNLSRLLDLSEGSLTPDTTGEINPETLGLNELSIVNNTDITSFELLSEREHKTPISEFVTLTRFLSNKIAQIRQESAIESSSPLQKSQTENKNRIAKVGSYQKSSTSSFRGKPYS